MKNCIYKFKINGNISPILNEKELILFLSMTNGNTLDDVITKLQQGDKIKFELDGYTVAQNLRGKIKEIKENKNQNLLKLDKDHQDVQFEDSITALRLIELNADQFGGTIISAADREEYSEERRNQLLEQGKSEDEIKQIIGEELNKWTRLLWDGLMLHTFSVGAIVKAAQDAVENFQAYIENFELHRTYKPLNGEDPLSSMIKYRLNEDFQDLSKGDENDNYKHNIIQFYKKLNHLINQQLKGFKRAEDKNGEIIGSFRSVYLTADLEENILLEAKKVGVHIDNLIIDENGYAHVFNYKFTSIPSKYWSQVKKDRYLLEMSIIREILQRNGVKVDQGTFENIPIIIEYDDNNRIKNLRIEQYNNDNAILSYGASNSATESKMARVLNSIRKFFPFDPNYQKIEDIDLSFDLTEADEFTKLLCPTIDAKAKALKISAEAWIRKEMNNAIVEGDNVYKIAFPNGEIVEVPYDKQALIDEVEKHLDLLNAEMPLQITEIVNAIKNSYALGYPSFEKRGFKGNASFLTSVFQPYLEKDINDNRLWEPLMNKDLNGLGIFLFRNKKTEEIQVITVSALRLTEEISRKMAQTGLLNYYEMDAENITDLDNTYGSLELMRTIAILNQVIKNFKNSKIGTIKIISPYFRGEAKFIMDAGNAVKEFDKIRRYFNSKLDKKFTNNFNNSSFVKLEQAIINTMEEIMASNSYIKDVANFNKDMFENADSVATKIQLLMNIIDSINEHYKDPEIIFEKRHSQYPNERKIFEIYKLANEYILFHTGLKQFQIKHFSSLEKNIMPQYAHPDENLRHLAGLYAREMDLLAQDYNESYYKMRDLTLKFYKKKGITEFDFKLTGSATQAYKNMFKIDQTTGKKIWMFVDPYNEQECRQYNLSNDDIDFLKRALFHLAKMRERARGKKFEFTSIEDPKLKAFREDANNNYFIVPLVKRSNDVILDAIAKYKNAKKAFDHMKESEEIKKIFTDLFNNTQHKYADNLDYDKQTVYEMGVQNSLIYSENPNIRAQMINHEDESYWETNIEYILAEYTQKQLEYEHLKKVELCGKSMLFMMRLVGMESGQRANRILQESITELEDFMKINIYNKPLNSGLEQDFVNFMQGAKRIMTNLFIAANLRSAMRDTFEGVWQNTIKTMTKFNTNIDTKNVYEAYTYVLDKMFKSDRDINVISELCLRYRLSNTDSAKASERSKIGRGGILKNPANLAFSTLRGPDFLNRMTLFVAKCLQDGTWSAFSTDENNHLVYNPREDERFKAYFKNDKHNPDYLKAKSAYFTAVRNYNLEHDESQQIGFDITKEVLPEAYTQTEIERHRQFSNMIYGAYDKSLKSKYEFLAFGHTFAIFSTWFNGQSAAWLMRPGKYYTQYTTHDKNGNPYIKKNDAGNELYFDNDGNIYEKRNDGNFYDDDGNMLENINNEEFFPVIDQIPIWVQGVLYTLRDSLAVVLEAEGGLKGKVDEFKKRILVYDVNRMNFRKLFSDVFMFLIYMILFGGAFGAGILTQKNKEYWKSDEHYGVAADMLLEVTFGGLSQSFEGFMGPVALFDYALNDLKPSAMQVNTQLIKNALQLVMGDKTAMKFLTTNIPVFRTFKSTAKYYMPESFKVNRE